MTNTVGTGISTTTTLDVVATYVCTVTNTAGTGICTTTTLDVVGSKYCNLCLYSN